MSEPVARWSRRRAMGLAATGAMAGGAALVLGPAGTASAVTLESHSELWDQRTYYESTGRAMSFPYDPQFYRQCETWLTFFYSHTPNAWLLPFEVWCDGVYVDKPGMHGQGRAFDLTRIYVNWSGDRLKSVDADFDTWKKWQEGPVKAQVRKHYWGTVASLNYHFTYVIHYFKDEVHETHVHFDNQVSGGGLGTFSTSHTTQVQSTQAILRYVFGYSTGIDGSFGPQTDSHSRDVLAKLGRSGGLTTSAANWRAFNEAGTLWGTGRRTGPITPLSINDLKEAM